MTEYKVENIKENIDTIKNEVLDSHEIALIKTDKGNMLLISEEDYYDNVNNPRVPNDETLLAMETVEEKIKNRTSQEGYSCGENFLAAINKKIEERKIKSFC